MVGSFIGAAYEIVNLVTRGGWYSRMPEPPRAADLRESEPVMVAPRPRSRAAVDDQPPLTLAGTASDDTGGTVHRLAGALGAYPVFRRLWLGAMAASLGQWMQQIALGWLALTMTNSPSFVGLVGFTAGLPFLLVSIPAGVLIDRFDRRRLLLRCQALAALLAIAISVVVLAGWIEPWVLLVAAFANGTLQALVTPTQQALVPAIVPRQDLTNAIGLMSAGQNMTRVVGPSIAGAIIATAGVGPAFLLQATSVAVAFSLVSRLALPTRAPAGAGGRGGIFDGMRLIARRPDLRGLFLLACIPTFFVFPYIQFLSVFARDILHIGAAGLGLLLAASGSGAIIGSMVTATRRRTDGTGRLILILTVVYGLVIVGIAESRSIWLSLPLLVIAGMTGAAFMSSNNALLQHRITDDVRGRVMSAYLLTFGLMPLGAMPMGLVAAHFGTPTAVASGAIASSVLAGLLGLASPTLREM
jgi:predicted MFS family arabinose efflux permease